MIVRIIRSPGYYTKIGEINIDAISHVIYDNISGGINKRQPGYSLYGYIDYSVAMELVDCSGEHEEIARSAKICIPKKLNTKEPYWSAYRELESRVENYHPTGMIKRRRPEGGKPCTKRIEDILTDVKEIRRKELRNMLAKEGYYEATVRSALKTLEWEGRLDFSESSGNKLSQIIRSWGPN